MPNRDKIDLKKSAYSSYQISTAQRFIHLFDNIRRPNEEQRAMLAAAYYTLATQKNISCNKSKMHVNAAIALLKNISIQSRKENWCSQIAHAYFKRAEILEEKNAFASASHDYQEAIKTLESAQNDQIIDEEDRLLVAQSAISIADLLVNEQVEELEKKNLEHPLFYINKALEQLANIQDMDDDIWATASYAHQIAGISLSQHYFDESKEAFRVALLMAFKTETFRVCPLLADIYTCLGLVYEQQNQYCLIKKEEPNILDHAMIYFGLSLIFSPNEAEQRDEDLLVLESLFEMIYRALDPYLSPLSHRATCDLIDALIYAYMCLNDKALPNQVLSQQLEQTEALDAYAQHIYWLVIEAQRQSFPELGLLEIADPSEAENSISADDILDIIQNDRSDNVYYLPR